MKLFRIFFYLLFIGSILATSCASTKYRVDKTSLIDHFENNHIFKESHTGFLVYDIQEKNALFDYNSHKHFTPASNTKLLTYLASLKMMPDSVPAMKYCFVDDTLFFTGTGDPTLLYPNFEYGKTLDFLANEQSQLVYIPRPNEDKRLGPGWSWDDYPYYYSAEKSSFPIYGNLVHFKKDSSASSVTVTPNYFFEDIGIFQDTTINNFWTYRKEFSNEFELHLRNDSIVIEDVVPFIYSNELFVKMLSDTLGKTVTLKTGFPGCESKTLYSIPTDSISKHILIESDNFLAEQMLLLISNQLGDTLSSKKAIKSMMENQLADLEEEIHWVDGSGLSRYNQVTPYAMVEVLKEIYSEVPKNKLYQMLPEANLSGTLSNSFANLEGSIHAKTGSMSHVYCLSGYLETKSGKTLLFSFMNNNFSVSFSELKTEMERVLSVFVNDKK